MRLHFRRITFALLAMAPLTGCRLFDGAVADIPHPLDGRTLEAMRVRMRTPLFWTKSRQSSLLGVVRTDAEFERTLTQNRWEYRAPLLRAVVRKLDETGDANRYLERLAHDDGIVGWNATILLARRDAQAALPFVRTLERLTSERLSYDAKSGRPAPTKPIRRHPLATGKQEFGRGPNQPLGPAGGNYQLSELAELMLEESKPGTEKAKPAEVTWWDKLTGSSPDESNKPKYGSPVPEPMRYAAAEAWCRVLSRSTPDPVDGLAPVGRLLVDSHLSDDVRAELIQGVAPFIPPARIPRFDAAFVNRSTSRHSSAVVRKAAIEACVVHAWFSRRAKPANQSGSEDWPLTIRNLAIDPSPELRALYGRWAALAHVDEAESLLESQQRDRNHLVQQNAVYSLALMGTPDVRRRLRSFVNHESVPLRRAAVSGLARWGAEDLVPFLNDASFAVRSEVAAAVGSLPGEQSAALLRHLLKDPHLDVQKSCVTAVKDWPDVSALPILLKAMAESHSTVALAAWRDVQGRQRIFSHFSATADSNTRQAQVERIVRQLGIPRWNSDPTLLPMQGLARAERLRYEHVIANALERIAKSPQRSPEYQSAAQVLAEIEKPALPILERLLQTASGTYPRELYDEILPKCHPVYRALARLSHRDPLERQRAAQRLAAYGHEASLSPFVVEQMLERIGDYPDRVVWEAAVRAVMNDATPQAQRIAVRASQLPASNVRVVACQYFQRHPRTEFGERLLELMNDTQHRTVQLAAVRAAGFCRNSVVISGIAPAASKESVRPAGHQSPRRAPSEQRFGLVKWVMSSDREIAEAAAVSLAQLGHELGYRELHRMSFHDDPATRARAFRLMGQSGKPRFVPHLIQRGSGEQSPKAQQAILGSLEKLTQPGERPLRDSANSGYDARMGNWRRWLQTRESSRTTRTSR